MHVVGIDAGGTKTVGLLADEDGRVLAEARGTGANLQTHGELEVEKVLDGVLESLRLADSEPIAALCLGIAGVDRPRDEATIRNILRRLGHRETARVVNDAMIALAAGAPDAVGIVVLAGTGSIAYGRDESGRTARSGGFGYLLGDEGSGYWLGHGALRAVVRAADGRGPHTSLAGAVLAALELPSVSELIPLVYERGLAKYRIAALAPLVQQAHDGGDVVATALVLEGARELALGARTAASKLAFSGGAWPVVLAGGAFKACPSMVPVIQHELGAAGSRTAVLQAEPARGAVTLALDLLRGRGAGVSLSTAPVGERR